MKNTKKLGFRTTVIFAMCLATFTLALNVDVSRRVSNTPDKSRKPEAFSTASIGIKTAEAGRTRWSCMCRRKNENNGRWQSNWHGKINEYPCDGIFDCLAAIEVAEYDAKITCNEDENEAGVTCQKCSCS